MNSIFGLRKFLNRGWWQIVAVVMVLLTSGIASAAGPAKTAGKAHSRMSKEIEKIIAKKGGPRVDVLVQYVHAPDANSDKNASAVGATMRHHFGFIRTRHYSMAPAAIQKLLANDPNIRYISPNRSVSGSLDYAASAVGANVAQSIGYDGQGVGVAVIDSGITDNADLAGRVVYRENFVASETTTDDLYGHGTHVAGIIGGDGASSTCDGCKPIRGMAPKVNLIDLRVLSANGAGYDVGIIAAIQRAIELQATYNIRVINLSVGRGIYESYAYDPLCQAVEQAWKNGIVVVVAAGNLGRDNTYRNNGYATITAPGNDPFAITVGATRTMSTETRDDDQVATYSSKGPSFGDHIVKPDLVAPGNQIASLLDPNSTLATQFPGNIVPVSYYNPNAPDGTTSNYFRLSGTSMATPMVSGAAALLIQQNPVLTPDQVKARLMMTAWKGFLPYYSWTDSTGASRTIQSDVFTVGAGYLDLVAALSDGSLIADTLGAAKSPVAVYNPKLNQAIMGFTSSSVLGKSVTWGTSVVWGTAQFSGTNTAGTDLIWGSDFWGASSTAKKNLVGKVVSYVWSISSDCDPTTAECCDPSTGCSVTWGASLLACDPEAGNCCDPTSGSCCDPATSCSVTWGASLMSECDPSMGPCCDPNTGVCCDPSSTCSVTWGSSVAGCDPTVDTCCDPNTTCSVTWGASMFGRDSMDCDPNTGMCCDPSTPCSVTWGTSLAGTVECDPNTGVCCDPTTDCSVTWGSSVTWGTSVGRGDSTGECIPGDPNNPFCSVTWGTAIAGFGDR